MKGCSNGGDEAEGDDLTGCCDSNTNGAQDEDADFNQTVDGLEGNEQALGESTALVSDSKDVRVAEMAEPVTEPHSCRTSAEKAQILSANDTEVEAVRGGQGQVEMAGDIHVATKEITRSRLDTNER